MDQKEEFIDMVEKNKGLIYKVASFYADNTHDREDLFQEIIYQLWRSFSSFQNNSSVSTWMYQVAMNTAIFFLKKNKRKLPVESLGNEILEYPEPEAAKTEEYFQIMNHHIKGLNLMERGIVMLYLEGRSYEEISSLIGISASNVGTRLSRIREKLKAQISKTH